MTLSLLAQQGAKYGWPPWESVVLLIVTIIIVSVIIVYFRRQDKKNGNGPQVK